MIQLIPYILTLMILYDFSLHIYDLLRHFKKTKGKHPFGMYLVADYFAGSNGHKWWAVYHIFWTIYWGIASILILVYVLALSRI